MKEFLAFLAAVLAWGTVIAIAGATTWPACSSESKCPFRYAADLTHVDPPAFHICGDGWEWGVQNQQGVFHYLTTSATPLESVAYVNDMMSPWSGVFGSSPCPDEPGMCGWYYAVNAGR